MLSHLRETGGEIELNAINWWNASISLGTTGSILKSVFQFCPTFFSTKYWEVRCLYNKYLRMWLAEEMEREERVCAVGAGIPMMVSSWGRGTACPSPWAVGGTSPRPAVSSRCDFDFPVGMSGELWTGAHRPCRHIKGVASFDLCWDNLKWKVGNFISADLLIKKKVH